MTQQVTLNDVVLFDDKRQKIVGITAKTVVLAPVEMQGAGYSIYRGYREVGPRHRCSRTRVDTQAIPIESDGPAEL